MHKRIVTFILVFLIVGVSAFSTLAQEFDYSYTAQKRLIPKALGKVYLGMSFKELSQEMNLNRASVGDLRFEWFELTIPLDRDDIQSVRVRIHGVSKMDRAEMVVSETDSDDEEKEIDRILVSKIPKNGMVYAMYVTFKQEFKLKPYVVKLYGKDGEVRKPDDEYRLYDIEWRKQSSDGLKWLIRSFHEGDDRVLQLLGRIPGSEWDAS